ncbi:hypothetical protein EVAR_38242_1 [Eumeta japonica]|uniref:Uncharacterized protein n=1 Tax=Eumeta variegata TaxID=151549 RepID=A0A4C1YBA2_EUMVA|nr:hypothetical protein EVAR_38242_1 [Eumeta japonica]
MILKKLLAQNDKKIAQYRKKWKALEEEGRKKKALSASGGARPNVGVSDISFARPFSLPSQKYVIIIGHKLAALAKYYSRVRKKERGRRRSPTSPTPSAATVIGIGI